ncbi:hypothetical protein ACFPIJ_48265 [Dactylosporangium cerinum]|uniref:Uncharacterized protein n=1 Tax=Dactylosporangium cerinum TaxID=1434730 RepID=A0ABV9WAY2_9ACTN
MLFLPSLAAAAGSLKWTVLQDGVGLKAGSSAVYVRSSLALLRVVAVLAAAPSVAGKFFPGAHGAGAGEVDAAADYAAHDRCELRQVPDALRVGLNDQSDADGLVNLHQAAYAAGWMSATIVRAARDHGERCGGCQTCRDLSELLSGVAAVQILNPPPLNLLDPARAVNTRAALTADDILQRELLAMAAGARRRMPLVVIVLVALAAATVAALIAKAAGM